MAFTAARERDAGPVTSPKPVRGLPACRLYLKFLRDPIACLREASEAFGPVCALGSVLPFPGREQLCVFALGPEFNRRVLNEPDLFRGTGLTIQGPRNSAQRRIRHGPPRTNGQKHLEQRRMTISPLQTKAVDTYCQAMAAVTSQTLTDWSSGQTRDMWIEMRKLALRISEDILFAREKPEDVYVLGQLIHGWLRRNFTAGVWMFPINIPGTPYRGFLKHAERLEQEILRMIEEKRTAPSTRGDIVSLLLRAQDEHSGRMSDADVVAQTTVMFAASYETVASALIWTLFLLAQHTSVMADLLDELDGTLQGAAPTSEQLDQLPLLEAVIQESMRLLPPVPYLIRAATAPIELGGVSVRRGDRVICSQYWTHHMPALYDDPEAFRPERWFGMKPGPYEYLPFGAGPHACVGYMFAMTVIKVSVAMILQRFRLTVVPGARIDRHVQVTLNPKYGLPMSIHPQDRQFQAVSVRGNIHEMVDLT